MKESDIVFVVPLNMDGILMSFATDVITGKTKCIVYCDDEKHYIVDESEIVFFCTLEESLVSTLTGKPVERMSA